MNWWNIFILFLCILEYHCLRQFLNLLQASLQFSKHQLPSIVTLIISVNLCYLILYLKLFKVICHIMFLVFLLREALNGFVWHRHK